MRAVVELSHELHPDEWAARHAAEEVPDRWPYGLHRLAGHGVQPVLRTPVRGRAPERIGAALRNRGGGLEWLDALAGPRAQRRHADAVLCWDERTGVPAVLRERISGRRPVITGVVWLTDRYQVSATAARAARLALPRAALVWASSSAMIGPLVADWGVPASRVRHIPLGIDPDFFRPRAVHPEPGLVVSAGNDRHRDHDLLVRAMHQVRRRHVGARAEIATRLPVRIGPEIGAARSGLHEGQVAGLYARASVVAVATMPNVHASGLTVILEAMACGAPVVVPDNPGLVDYVVPGETGLVYPVGDEDALASCLSKLLADPAAGAAMGQAGRRLVEQNYTTEHQAALLAEAMLAC
ncbi:MAG TPA: glycosyltransferase family 4 protein [Pseudonocardiaceae bacterium]|nr:glycosyltransferase family 4 protein [Pseudonocardiaceae bacterium]